ncbi:hypothetical protein ACWGRK_03040 [Saccharomonospora azurea]|uniref:PE domain-containing protein n=1 Tax=Saccharomonospora azurea NA-128 TaxID=882081 RepID=H8GAC5_9PSEU|nr:hypothetical protein [Saccharomonospora azurea]EHY89622.1 hypothetical protein SacazDRAFT_02730 [Saccharomonospora azurea NA-128]
MVNVAMDGGGASVGGAAAKMIAVRAPAIAGAPAPSSGGYRFSREEIDGVIRQWEDLHRDLLDDYRQAEGMARVQPPGSEPASQDFTSSANPSGKAFAQATLKMIDYVEKYIEALRNARDGITTREDESQEHISRVGSGVMEV